MKIRKVAALAAFAAASQLLQDAPALATSIQEDRRSTLLAAQLLADSTSARLALIRHNTGLANKDIALASGVRDKMAQLAKTNGMSMVVPIYTELDDNAALSGGLTVSNQEANESEADRVKSLEVTYFAIDLGKVKTRLDAATLAVRDNNDQSAENSLAAIRNDLIQSKNAADVPLLTARRDLALAQRDINAKQLSDASAKLQDASNSLKSYSSVDHTTAAQQLAADIKSAMPLTAQAGTGVSTKIDGWWASLTTWFSHRS